MKKCCYIVLLLLISVSGWGQMAEDRFADLMQEYVEARVQGNDSALLLDKLNDLYRLGDERQQRSYRDMLTGAIASALRADEHKQVLEMTGLHELLVARLEDRRPELYLIEGTIYSRQGDSTRLKESIRKLESLGRGEQMLQRLNGYLEQMRRYVSADKLLEGYWVSDVRDVQKWMDVNYPIEPFCIFKAEQTSGTPIIKLQKPSPYLRNLPLGVKASTQEAPQAIIPFSTDSLYIIWSSEKMRNVNPENVSSYRNVVRETSAQAHGVISQRHVYGDSERLANGMLIGLFEQGVNSLISALATPNKIITVMELRLRRINDRLYKGTMHYYWGSVSAEGRRQENEWTLPVTFYKWDIESGVLFGYKQGDSQREFYVAQNPDIQKDIAKNEDGYYKQNRQSCNRMATTKQYYGRMAAFNTVQYRLLELYNQEQLDSGQIPIIASGDGMTMCGWSGMTAVEAEDGGDGVLVVDVMEVSPAFVADIRTGDMIKSIDGIQITTPQALRQFEERSRPGQEVLVEIVRKNKQISRIMRLTYQIIPETL